MLNMKKVLIAGTVLTALCATAFAATNDEAQKPTMKERVNAILAEGRTDCPTPQECRSPRDEFGPKKGMRRHHKDFRKMSPEQREEMQKRRAEWEKMTPEQRQEAHEKWQKERAERHEQRAKETMAKLTPEQKAEVEAFIKEDMAQREARRAKLQNMTPEQREAVRANRPLKPRPPMDGKHFKGHGPKEGEFRGHGPMHPAPRPDCQPPECPVAPAK